MLRARQKLGKFRIERRLAEGGFATVYKAYDTVEGIHVALKVPHLLSRIRMEDFRREARLTAGLDHPNILPIKYAGEIEGTFVIVYPLGEESLDERLKRRMSVRRALDYGEQMLQALAHAHAQRVIHCDVKPENLVIFSGDRLRLTDFGIARVALRTVSASGAGTVGYVAPEQAMGKPSLRSDVFSAGLIMYEMLTRELPEWPFDWPPPGIERLRRKVHPSLAAWLRRALDPDERKRFESAVQMLQAFRKAKPRTIKLARARRRARREEPAEPPWRQIRHRDFQRAFGRELATGAVCPKCAGPIAETMSFCPWCGSEWKVFRGPSRFPRRCPRCRRGRKLDWRFCAWCFGPGLARDAAREYGDVRYVARCPNPQCERKDLMAFMRYCPWCRTKVRRAWKVPGSEERCGRCGWGIVGDYWDFCPWCGRGKLSP